MTAQGVQINESQNRMNQELLAFRSQQAEETARQHSDFLALQQMLLQFMAAHTAQHT